jgi:hypothetical protein
MRIPVLVVTAGQGPLRESALAFQERRSPTIPVESADMPPGLQLDPTTPAIPIGTGRREDTLASLFNAESSPAFAVRATVDVDRPEDVPEDVAGRQIFADPRIDHFITCGGTPAVGDTAAVATKLNIAALTAGGRGLDGTNVAVAIMDTGINLAFLSGKVSGARLDAANSWTPPGGTTLPGRYPVDHGTMCAYDVLIGAPKATLLDFPILSASAPGGSTSGRTLSVAMTAFSQLFTSWGVSFAAGGVSKYTGLVDNKQLGHLPPKLGLSRGPSGSLHRQPSPSFQSPSGSYGGIRNRPAVCGRQLRPDLRGHPLRGPHCGGDHGCQRARGCFDGCRMRYPRSDRGLFVTRTVDRWDAAAEAGHHRLHAFPRLGGIRRGKPGHRYLGSVSGRCRLRGGTADKGFILVDAPD